jgi:phosphoribosyl 1,2-cyclic phosphodiesterase
MESGTKSNEFTVRGARGTVPVSGGEFLEYGGRTTCFSVRVDDGLIVFDAGTGLSHVASSLTDIDRSVPISIVFTHFHLDHVVGLPYFTPFYRQSSDITVMADPRREDDWKGTLKTLIGKPYWPLGFSDFKAELHLRDLPVGDGVVDLYGVKISWFDVPHPQKCLAYRVELPDQVVVVATDVEYEAGEVDPGFVEFCRDADVLLHDATYTPEEYGRHRGWGHSTWEVAALTAGEAKVGRLILTHHAPDRTDDDVACTVEAARNVFPSTDAARENMVLGGRSACC